MAQADLPVTGHRIVVHNVDFEARRATITPESIVALDTVAEALQAAPDALVVVICDPSESINADVARQRTESVRVHLRERGIRIARVQIAPVCFGSPDLAVGQREVPSAHRVEATVN